MRSKLFFAVVLLAMWCCAPPAEAKGPVRTFVAAHIPHPLHKIAAAGGCSGQQQSYVAIDAQAAIVEIGAATAVPTSTRAGAVCTGGGCGAPVGILGGFAERRRSR